MPSHLLVHYLRKPDQTNTSKNQQQNNLKKLTKRLTLEEIAHTKPEDRTFIEDFRLSFDEVWQALRFVLTSYQRFPAVLSRFTLVQLNEWWNKLLGKTNSL